MLDLLSEKMQPKMAKNATKTPFTRIVKGGIKFHDAVNVIICSETIYLVLYCCIIFTLKFDYVLG